MQLKLQIKKCFFSSKLIKSKNILYRGVRRLLSKKQRDNFANKDVYSQSYGFSCSHVWVWELDYKESWALKNWCFWTVVLEKTLESPLDYKEIQPVHPKGNQSWIFTGRTYAEAEAPVLWPPGVKCQLTRKDLNAGKDWGQEKWVTAGVQPRLIQGIRRGDSFSNYLNIHQRYKE